MIQDEDTIDQLVKAGPEKLLTDGGEPDDEAIPEVDVGEDQALILETGEVINLEAAESLLEGSESSTSLDPIDSTVSSNWDPTTRLGEKVKSGETTAMKDALLSGLPLKEPEIVDALLDLEDEVLDINMVQRTTDSGRRVKFRCIVVVGNRNGFVGYAEGRGDQVGEAIQKATDIAKLNIVHVPRGCGSFECTCGHAHTVPTRTSGKAGRVEVDLMPAPRGLGLAGGETIRTMLELAGIEDAWTQSSGATRTTVNFAKATFNALSNLNEATSNDTLSQRQSAREDSL